MDIYQKLTEPKPLQLPPGLSDQPALQLLSWIFTPLTFLERCYQNYGDTFTIRLHGFEPIVMISNPKAIEEIFSNSLQYCSGRANDIVKLRPLLGDNSLVLIDGESHRRQRRLLVPPFHGESLRSNSQTICDLTQDAFRCLTPGKPFYAKDVMRDITLEVILHVVFGISYGPRHQQLKPLLEEMLLQTASPIGYSFLFFEFLQKQWGPWGKMMARQTQIRRQLQQEIEERRASEETARDVLSLLVSARDEEGNSLSDLEMQDELLTMLVAGHETTATTLAWAFYWLCSQPEIKNKVLQELAQLGSNPEPLAITRLPYLSAFCQETLRIYPVFFINSPRVAETVVTVNGRNYAQGTYLVPCTYLLHHREDLYPNPKQFRPERFLEKQYAPHEFITFGGGNRRCLGAALATLELKLVLTTILLNWEVELVNEKPCRPVRSGLTIAPHDGVPLVIKHKIS